MELINKTRQSQPINTLKGSLSVDVGESVILKDELIPKYELKRISKFFDIKKKTTGNESDNMRKLKKNALGKDADAPAQNLFSQPKKAEKDGK